MGLGGRVAPDDVARLRVPAVTGDAGHRLGHVAVEGGQDHDSDPVQVKAAYTGVELDAGFYSRLREINPDSSFSVNG